MALEMLEFYNGLTGTIFFIVSIIVGVKLISKYFEQKGLTKFVVSQFLTVLMFGGSYNPHRIFLPGLLLLPFPNK